MTVVYPYENNLVDASILYPIVHDLSETEEDASSPKNVPWCAGGGCFDLRELLVPSEEPRAICEGPCPTREPERSNSIESVVSEASAEHSYVPSRPERFQDVYVLTRQIYQGNSSMVWESIDRQTGLRYAVKIVDRRAITAVQDARVVREVALLKSLDSNKGTISCVDFYQEAQHYYIVSEFAEGGSLQQRLVEKRKLPEAQVKELAKSLLQGLQYLHQHDICHRNIKPDNILIHIKDDGGEVALIGDFGTAIHLPHFDEGRGQVTGKCGSSFYAAPEVQNRNPYDTQCDMFSLGVVLFLSLSGSLPFIDKNRRSLLRKITRAEFIFDPKDWSTVSRSARQFIWRLLRADPSERMTAERALRDAWLNPPVLPAIAEEIPIEQTLSDSVSVTAKKVRFVDLPKPNKKKAKLHRVFSSILGFTKDEKEDGDDSISSHTMSTTSTDPGGVHFLGTTAAE